MVCKSSLNICNKFGESVTRIRLSKAFFYFGFTCGVGQIIGKGTTAADFRQWRWLLPSSPRSRLLWRWWLGHQGRISNGCPHRRLYVTLVRHIWWQFGGAHSAKMKNYVTAWSVAIWIWSIGLRLEGSHHSWYVVCYINKAGPVSNS